MIGKHGLAAWRLSGSVIVLAAAALTAPAPAFADEAAGTPPTQLEEVVVTTQKRETRAQDTPSALSVFSAGSLENRGVAAPEDLQFAVPGLTFGGNVGAGGAQVALRGIGSENLSVGGDPGVAIHVDGVYNQAPTFLTRDFFDVQRVEVLRGPQGTLYGRNATGGSINIITRQPTDEFSATARVTLGSYDQRKIQLALGGPIAGSAITGRLSISSERRDGYEKNISPIAPEKSADTADYWSARAQVRFELGDNLTATVRGYYLDDRSKRQPLLILQPYPTGLLFEGFDFATFAPVLGNPYLAAGSAPNPTVLNRREYRSNFGVGSGEIAKGGALEINWRLGWATLTSLTGIDDSRSHLEYDVDASDAVSIAQTRDETQYRTVSQEVRLASPDSGRLVWLVGAYYYHEKSNFDFELQDASFPGTTPGGGPLTFTVSPARVTAESWAVFGQASWKLSDQLTLTVGLRGTRDTKTGADGVYAPNFLILDPSTFGPIFHSYDKSWTNTSGTIGLKYDLNRDVMAYATVSTGYKAGGLNLGGFQDPYDPEKVTAYEAGFKSRFWDRRAQLNLAAFYYDYKSLQVFQIQNLLAAITNAARAKSKGIEVEFAVAPTPALLIEASAGWLDARYDQFSSSDPMQPAAGVIDLSGNRLNRSPEWKASLGVQYTWSLGAAGSLMVRGDVAWTAAQYYRAFNLPQDRQSAYHRTDLRLVWRDAGSRYRVEGWVKNLEDDDVLTSVKTGAATLGPTFNGILAPPRTFGVTFGADF